ncbi:MAG: hypothetical protein AB4290_02105 [Spirulina sp.]
MLVIGYWLLVIGYWLLVIGYWLLVISYWLLVIGYWLLVVGYWFTDNCSLFTVKVLICQGERAVRLRSLCGISSRFVEAAIANSKSPFISICACFP